VTKNVMALLRTIRKFSCIRTQGMCHACLQETPGTTKSKIHHASFPKTITGAILTRQCNSNLLVNWTVWLSTQIHVQYRQPLVIKQWKPKKKIHVTNYYLWYRDGTLDRGGNIQHECFCYKTGWVNTQHTCFCYKTEESFPYRLP